MNVDRSKIVITSTGVHIGGHYLPPAPGVTLDTLALQSALIDKPAPLIERLSDFAERAAGIAMTTGAIGGVAFGIVKHFLH